MQRAKIQKLDNLISDKIAAGEVIERPASVVKELVENSIDAGATKITIEIKNSGKTLIKVSDNGCGIPKDEISLAFERHATSKIRSIEDVYAIDSLGFRGEALSSISSVSRVEIISRCNDDVYATKANLEDGVITDFSSIGANTGTSIAIRDLFYNTPARFNFLKSNRSEISAISDLVDKLAISHPLISFTYIVDDNEMYRTDGRGMLLNTLLKIYGDDFIENLIPLEYSKNNLSISGYISKPEYSRGNRRMQMIFINGRYVKKSIASDYINIKYKRLIAQSNFPAFVLFINISPNKIDANIHPTKSEVLFKDNEELESIFDKLLDEKFANQNYFKEYNAPISKSDVLTVQNYEQLSIAEKQPTSSFVIKPDVSSISIENKLFGKIEKNNNKCEISKSFSDVIEKINGEDDFVHNDLLSIDNEEGSVSKSAVDNETNWVSEDIIASFFEELQRSASENIQIIEENFQIIDMLKEAKILSQAFSKFILCESADNLLLIDQHLAHERVLYENLLTSFSTTGVESQILLSPIEYNYDIDEEVLKALSAFGIMLDSYNGKFCIISVPIIFGSPLSTVEIFAIIDKMTEDSNLSITEILCSQFAKLSCRRAVTANSVMSDSEMVHLIESLKNLKFPYVSPHGKKIITKINIEMI